MTTLDLEHRKILRNVLVQRVALLRREIGAVEIAGLERDPRELTEVEQALRRLDRGELGTCGDCGKDIEWERLRAQPQATRCIRCETRGERARAPLQFL